MVLLWPQVVLSSLPPFFNSLLWSLVPDDDMNGTLSREKRNGRSMDLGYGRLSHWYTFSSITDDRWRNSGVSLACIRRRMLSVWCVLCALFSVLCGTGWMRQSINQCCTRRASQQREWGLTSKEAYMKAKESYCFSFSKEHWLASNTPSSAVGAVPIAHINTVSSLRSPAAVVHHNTRTCSSTAECVWEYCPGWLL